MSTDPSEETPRSIRAFLSRQDALGELRCEGSGPPYRFLHDAMWAGVVLGWLSVAAVLAAFLLGVHVERSQLVIALTAGAATAHTAITLAPWARWLRDRRGRALLDIWAFGLLVFVALLVIAGGGQTGFDLLLFLVVPFLALVHEGRRRQLFLAGAALAYVGSMALTPHPLPLGAAALHAVLLFAVGVLALVLDRAVRRESSARATSAARAELEHALLAESHHRVKNSLQTVADLLLLSGRGDGGDGFDRTAERIRAIAAVHHLLSDRHGRAVDAEALLQSVARAAAPDIPMDLAADDVMLEPVQAQQLGIVANELIANAARHGRPPIAVRLSVSECVRLDVQDAGQGDGSRVPGLGLRLVRQVTENGLHGTFTLTRNSHGTIAHVQFPKEADARSGC